MDLWVRHVIVIYLGRIFIQEKTVFESKIYPIIGTADKYFWKPYL